MVGLEAATQILHVMISGAHFTRYTHTSLRRSWGFVDVSGKNVFWLDRNLNKGFQFPCRFVTSARTSSARYKRQAR